MLLFPKLISCDTGPLLTNENLQAIGGRPGIIFSLAKFMPHWISSEAF